MYRFLISSPGFRYELSFNERLLQACNEDDITKALRIVVQRTAFVPDAHILDTGAQHLQDETALRSIVLLPGISRCDDR